MAVTTTERLGITRWSSTNDAFSRSQMDSSHESLETLAAGFLKGVLASRPTAAAAYDRFFYLATDAPIVLYYCDGTTWSAVSSFATAGTITPGDAAAAGSAATSARSDHVHAIAGFGVVGEMAEVGTAGAGTTAKFARIDHSHAIATGSVGTAQLAALAVTAAKLAADSVATGSLIDAAVTTAKLGTSAVSTVKIADDAVTVDKLADNAVVNANIVDGTIAAAKLASGVGIPAGTVAQTVSASEPAGWKFFGQTITNCSGNYPNLWAAAPTSWRSGSDLILPTMSDKVPMGGGTLGASGGSNTVTLAAVNMPQHNHTMVHTHDSFYLAAGYGSHSHTIAPHSHTQDAHAHNLDNQTYSNGLYVGGATRKTLVSGTWTTDYQQPAISSEYSYASGDGDHQHYVSVPALSSSVTSGNSGYASPTAVTTTPAHLRLNFMVKT